MRIDAREAWPPVHDFKVWDCRRCVVLRTVVWADDDLKQYAHYTDSLFYDGAGREYDMTIVQCDSLRIIMNAKLVLINPDETPRLPSRL